MDILKLIDDLIKYPFLQRAFGAGLIIAIILPCIGMIVSLKRLSMIGDALSHTSLAGVAIGLMLGLNPIAGAVTACIIAALGIEVIRKYLTKFSEMAIAIIMSAGIGIAALAINLLHSPANFNSFLFGSIVAVSRQDFLLIALLSFAVLAVFALLYNRLFYVAFDENAARLSGVPVKSVNFIFTVMTAITISVASKIVGALVVSSIMILPVACAMQLDKGFKSTLLWSVLFAGVFTFVGMTLSYSVNLTPSGMIVIIAIIVFIAIAVVKALLNKRRLKGRGSVRGNKT